MTAPTPEDTDPRDDAARPAVDTPKPALNAEQGVGEQFFWSQQLAPNKFEVFNWDLDSNDESPSLAQLHHMRSHDGQVRSLYKLITQPIRAALNDLQVIPAEGGEEEAQFIEDMLKLPKSQGGMVTPLRSVTAELLNAVYDGFAAFELVYWIPKKGPLAGKIALKKMAYRPAATVTFITDKRGEFQGIRQKTYHHNEVIDVVIPAKNIIYYAAHEEERQYYGVSYFHSAWTHFDQKMRYLLAANLAANNSAMGMRVGKIPASASVNQRNGFVQQLANMGAAGYIMIPSENGWDVDFKTERSGYDFMAYVNFHNNQMSKSVLMPWWDSSQGSSQGDASAIKTSGQSDVQDNAYLAMLESILDEILGKLNEELIPRFIDWNFGTDKYPTIEVVFNDEQEQYIRSLFDKLASGNITREFMLELEMDVAETLGFTEKIDYDEIKAREKEQLEREQISADQAITAQEQQINAAAPPTTLDQAVTQTVTGAAPKPAAAAKPAAPKPAAPKKPAGA